MGFTGRRKSQHAEVAPAALPPEYAEAKESFKSLEPEATARALAAGAIARDVLLDALYEMDTLGKSLVGRGALAAEAHAREMDEVISDTFSLDLQGVLAPPLSDEDSDHLQGLQSIYQFVIPNAKKAAKAEEPTDTKKVKTSDRKY